MYPAVWELRATYHHVHFCCQVNESHSIAIGVVVETVRADSALKDVFFSHLGVEIAKHDFDVMFGTAVVRYVQLIVEVIFDYFVGIFGGGMGAYQTYIEKPSLYSDGAQSFVDWVPTNDVVPQFRTDYKSTSK
jgi:hypothetical protein